MRPTTSSAVALVLVLSLSGCVMRVSPLAAAARRGDVAEIDRLIAAGADPHEGSGVNGWTPLLHAVHKGREAAALRLMKESRAPSAELDEALFMAAGYAQTSIVAALLSAGADPRRTFNGSSALVNGVAGSVDLDYRFSGCGPHTETVKTLLAAAPDLRLSGAAGEAARHAAERRGCTELLALLDRTTTASN
jgi:ankyrin repeat protein